MAAAVVPELPRGASIRLNKPVLCMGSRKRRAQPIFLQSGPTVAKPSGDHIPPGGLFYPDRATHLALGQMPRAGDRCENGKQANAPINEEKMKRLSMRNPIQDPLQFSAPGFAESILYLSLGTD
jgi:hypothetical protein